MTWIRNKLLVFFVWSFLFHSCSWQNDGNDDFLWLLLFLQEVIPSEEYSGGWTTTFDSSLTAFNRLASNCQNETTALHFGDGNQVFKSIWSPAGSGSFDGLGPVFNQNSCNKCHPLGGRGKPPESGTVFDSMLFRISDSGVDAHGGPLQLVSYGTQLNDRSISGVMAEAQVSLSYSEQAGSYPDGNTYSLRTPAYVFQNWNFGTPTSFLYSPRVAPVIYGLGLLQAISEQTLKSFEDEFDTNQDGISGKRNIVYNPITGQMETGRFGWKAGHSTVEIQNQAALYHDIGITTSVFSTENCATGQNDCLASPSGNFNTTPEIKASDLKKLDIYILLVAVPARRNWTDQKVVEGKNLFEQAGCAKCHIPLMKTGPIPNYPELSHQWIRPYSDLLLHDMGPGLADNRSEYRATGNEWRTPPLWGSGRYQMIHAHQNLLHDGRARNFEEAILWHGGEAESSRQAFMNFTSSQRDSIIRFLESL